MNLLLTENLHLNFALPRVAGKFALSNAVTTQENVPFSTVVTLKIIKVALSEGIQMNLNLSVKTLANPGCPCGDTTIVKFKFNEVKLKSGVRLKFQLSDALMDRSIEIMMMT